MTNISLSENTFQLYGELKKETVKSHWDYIKKYIQSVNYDQVYFNLQEIKSIDSAGVAFLDEVNIFCEHNGKKSSLMNVSDNIQQAINSFSIPENEQKMQHELPGLLESLGEKVISGKQKITSLLYLTADIFYWSIVGLFKRKGQRKGSLIQQSVLIGVDALQIVALISFLIGLILALQSAAQLRQFGANIFIADLIGIAMLREMGPIMTAIVVAGRSGSAIASEIATMVVTEEIDALKTMALNPVRFVIVPKFHAITITMPLLTIMADLLGIFGGFIIGITYLQLSPTAFINELLTVLILKDVLTGLFKSVIFAWIIQIVACYQGLNVKGGAEGVGRATTASVVASIFLVIVADSIMGLIFYFE